MTNRFKTAVDDPLGTPMAVECPQALFLEYLEHRPVWHRDDGRVALFRMADVLAVNRNKEILANSAAGPQLGGSRPMLPLDYDGENHRRLRRLLDPYFAPKSKASRLPGIDAKVRRTANDLIDGFFNTGGANLYSDYAVPLFAETFLDLYGLEGRDYSFFTEFENDILRPAGDTVEAREHVRNSAAARMFDYLEETLRERERSAQPRDDLFGDIVSLYQSDAGLTRDEVVELMYGLTVGGFDSVSATLSCMLAWLAKHPADRAQLVADSSLWPAAVEELLRYETPVPLGNKYSVEAIALPSGATIGRDEYVQAVWAAANLDAEVFDEPMKVKFDRPRSPHLTFGSGVHRCIGEHLARIELRGALEELHRRIPVYAIKPGVELTYTHYPVRLVPNLAVVWDLSPADSRASET